MIVPRSKIETEKERLAVLVAESWDVGQRAHTSERQKLPFKQGALVFVLPVPVDFLVFPGHEQADNFFFGGVVLL